MSGARAPKKEILKGYKYTILMMNYFEESVQNYGPRNTTQSPMLCGKVPGIHSIRNERSFKSSWQICWETLTSVPPLHMCVSDLKFNHSSTKSENRIRSGFERSS